MPEQESLKTLEEEIRALEEKLAVRKAGDTGAEEKALFRDVLKEHVESAKESVEKQAAAEPTFPAKPVPATPPHDYAAQAKSKADDLREEEHRDQVEALVDIALTKGVLEAVRVARHLGNPHLLDDLHDMLVDEYYEKLLAARKIS